MDNGYANGPRRPSLFNRNATSSPVTVEFDYEAWSRLRDVVKRHSEATQMLEQLKRDMEESSAVHENLQDYYLAADIQLAKASVKMIQHKVAEVQRTCRQKKLAAQTITIAIKEKQEELNGIMEKAQQMADNADAQQGKIELEQKKLKIVSDLITRRRMTIIQEAVQIFDIKLDGGPASQSTEQPKKNCKCMVVDTIRNCHLPYMTAIPGHPEIETESAIGYTVHLLSVIGSILDYNFRYPLIPKSSHSMIMLPIENKKVPLFSWKKRSDREKFDLGVTLLGKNVAQLRSDTGIPTQVTHKTLQMIFDWANAVCGGSYVKIYQRPTNKISSPSSLLVEETYNVCVNFTEQLQIKEDVGDCEKDSADANN